MRSRVYARVGRLSVCLSVCLSARPIIRPQRRHAAGLLLSAVRAGNIDRQRRAPSSNGAAARRSAANTGSVMLTADLTRLNTDFWHVWCHGCPGPCPLTADDGVPWRVRRAGSARRRVSSPRRGVDLAAEWRRCGRPSPWRRPSRLPPAGPRCERPWC